MLTEFLNYFITFSNFKVVNSQSEFRKCEIVQKWHENNYAHRHIYLLFFNAVPANLRPRTLYHVKLQVTCRLGRILFQNMKCRCWLGYLQVG